MMIIIPEVFFYILFIFNCGTLYLFSDKLVSAVLLIVSSMQHLVICNNVFVFIVCIYVCTTLLYVCKMLCEVI